MCRLWGGFSPGRLWTNDIRYMTGRYGHPGVCGHVPSGAGLGRVHPGDHGCRTQVKGLGVGITQGLWMSDPMSRVLGGC